MEENKLNFKTAISIVVNGIRLASAEGEQNCVKIAEHPNNASLVIIHVPQTTDNFYSLLGLESSFAKTENGFYCIVVPISDINSVVR